MRCGSPCRVGAAGVPGEPSARTSSVPSPIRLILALTVLTTDVAEALVIAWDAFCGATRDDLTGWEVAAAAAEVQPEPPLKST
jgi:hypothetical protein